MDVALRTNTANPALALRGLYRWPESPPVPASWIARLVVQSGPFAAETRFYFDEFVLHEFLRDLRGMDRTLRGGAMLQTPLEDSFIRLDVGSTGSVTVSGRLVEYSEHAQSLEFSFGTDQTVLAPFVQDLETVIDE